MLDDNSNYLYSLPCPKCGSSDARAVYDNNTSFCFSCETYFPYGATEEDKRINQPYMDKKASKDLITGEIRALKKRKITEETCRKFNYQVGRYQGRPVQIANYYKDGMITGQKLRTPGKEFKTLGDMKTPELFGQHLWRNKGGKRIIITEGEIDCLTFAQVFNLNWPVVSVPHGAQSAKKYIKRHLEFLEGYDEIVLAFDGDTEGKKAVDECALLFTPGKVKVVSYPEGHKDANSMLQAGLIDKIAPLVFNAKTYRPDGILEGNDLTLEELLKPEETTSFTLPYKSLNNLLQGIRKGEITTLTAGTGIGKSTLARESAAYLMTEHGLKIGYVALEESIKKTALSFIAIDQNVPLGELFLNRDLLGIERFSTSYQKMVANNKLFLYDHFGSLDSDNLINKLRFLAIGCEVDFIVLDHISIVVSGIEGGDERRIIDNLMTNLRSLVENTGVGMILVSHLKVPEGKPHEEGGRVTLNQLRGSGSIKQLSDVIIGMERNQQSEKEKNIALLRVLKDRLFGVVGKAGKVIYNHETGRLIDYDRPDKEEEEEEDVEEYDDLPF